MGAIRAVLCDDEPEWLLQGSLALGTYGERTGRTFELQSYTDGAVMLRECAQAPDVLFCDIEFCSKASGIDLVREVAKVWPACQIVYVTNHLSYAPDVYVTDHMWFVLKDRFEERLPEIIDKLDRQLEDGTQVLSIKTVERSMVSLPCAQIVSFERKGRATTITLDDGETFQVADRLVELLDRLPSNLFCRTHGSFAVGLGYVRMVQRDSLTLQSGAVIPLSRRYARTFRERYLDWMEDHAL